VTGAARQLRFEVFGQVMLVERLGGEWRLFRFGGDGKRSPLTDAVIPDWIEEDELAVYLADLFHEHATGRHPNVVRIDSP
jgi:hypothetical protein